MWRNFHVTKVPAAKFPAAKLPVTVCGMVGSETGWAGEIDMCGVMFCRTNFSSILEGWREVMVCRRLVAC